MTVLQRIHHSATDPSIIYSDDTAPVPINHNRSYQSDSTLIVAPPKNLRDHKISFLIENHIDRLFTRLNMLSIFSPQPEKKKFLRLSNETPHLIRALLPSYLESRLCLPLFGWQKISKKTHELTHSIWFRINQNGYLDIFTTTTVIRDENHIRRIKMLLNAKPDSHPIESLQIGPRTKNSTNPPDPLPQNTVERNIALLRKAAASSFALSQHYTSIDQIIIKDPLYPPYNAFRITMLPCPSDFFLHWCRSTGLSKRCYPETIELIQEVADNIVEDIKKEARILNNPEIVVFQQHHAMQNHLCDLSRQDFTQIDFVISLLMPPALEHTLDHFAERSLLSFFCDIRKNNHTPKYPQIITVIKTFSEISEVLVQKHENGFCFSGLPLERILLPKKIPPIIFTTEQQTGDQHPIIIHQFSAPECFLSEDIIADPALDLWSLGLMLFTFIYGLNPFYAEYRDYTPYEKDFDLSLWHQGFINKIQSIQKILRNAPPHFSIPVAPLIAELLSTSPIDRPSAEDVFLQLKNLQNVRPSSRLLSSRRVDSLGSRTV